MSGRRTNPALDPMAVMATGFTAHLGGPGSPITDGDGPLSTTAGGLWTLDSGGSGFRDINGRLHGWLGEVVADIMAGLL